MATGRQGKRPRPTTRAPGPSLREHGYPDPGSFGRLRVPRAPSYWHKHTEPPRARDYTKPKNRQRELARRQRTSYRNTKEWRVNRVKALQRDRYMCRSCGVWGPGVSLVVDHILEWADGGSNALSNLQTLCARCHAVKSELTAKLFGRPGRGSRGGVRV